MSQRDLTAKLLIIGNSGVGKTNILLKFTANTFVMSHITTIGKSAFIKGIDFKSKTILVDGKKIKLQIWDTAGQQRFKTITQTYYKGAEGIILAYAINDQASFHSLQSWLKQIRQHASQDILIVIIGTKCDISDEERKITFAQGQNFASKQGLKYFEVSSKDNTNIENLFQHLGKQVKQKIQVRQRLNENMQENIQKLVKNQWKESQLKPMKNKDCKC